MKFCETQMGQDFFAQQIPQLIEALREIAAALKQPAAPDQPAALEQLPGLEGTGGETDVLSEIYSFEYMPESLTYRKSDPLNGEAKEAMNALLETLSPEQRELFLQYEAAENALGGNISRCAFKDGVRFAVQIFMAGHPYPMQKKEEEAV